MSKEYIVYEDLLRRGYRATMNINVDHLRLYRRDIPESGLVVYVFEEKEEIKLGDIVTGESVIIAIVDDEKDVTFYKANGVLLEGNYPKEEMEGDKVYTDLRRKGLLPKTGLKYGCHFRAYVDVNEGHSRYLIHATPSGTLPAYDLSARVRLANGVNKKMIFASENDGVKYVRVEWIKL